MSKTGAAVLERADGVILVLAVGETRRRDLQRAAESVQATAGLTGALLIGKYHRVKGRWTRIVCHPQEYETLRQGN
jgi:hypothetical protein